jgi:hypothetical protein
MNLPATFVAANAREHFGVVEDILWLALVLVVVLVGIGGLAWFEARARVATRKDLFERNMGNDKDAE